MEVAPPQTEIKHDGACSTPYMSAPSSPQRLGEFLSAPGSPTYKAPVIDDGDFEFEFSGRLDFIASPRAADELFYRGKIRAATPPETAVAETNCKKVEEKSQFNCGSRRRRWSISSFRISDMFLRREEDSAAENFSDSPAKGGFRRWKITDFLLFRSSSDGRATLKERKDPLRKYELGRKKKVDDLRNLSFRSTENGSKGSSSRISAHELHYTTNRAASNEMRKKTYLPYRPELLLGCVKFENKVHQIFRDCK